MRKADSFYHFERLIYQESLREGKEKLFLTNGRLFVEIGINGTRGGIDVDLTKESKFLEKYSGIFVYSYHTHIKDVHLDGYPTPPTLDDFCADRRFRERAKEKGKRIVSRVLEKNGVWQSSDTSKLSLPINLNEMIDSEIRKGGTPSNKVNRLIEGYERFGLPGIKFSKRDLV